MPFDYGKKNLENNRLVTPTPGLHLNIKTIFPDI